MYCLVHYSSFMFASYSFDKKKLPYHPCLELIGCCKQALTGHSSRYLITMKKIKENVSIFNLASFIFEILVMYLNSNFISFILSKVLHNFCNKKKKNEKALW